VSRESHPDPSQFEKKSEYYDPKATEEKPIWYLVEVKFVKKFAEPILLENLRKEKALKDMWLLRRGSRLSINPVSEKEWKHILSLTK
jgi:predicted RNA-binding protein with PUA-like domain